ncbi:hypothetical protein BB560_007198 [Smittium megazygosporum]|uniref:Uncharacterized protein n=1 Tax=Smittium megazygosporum TaxID=133381 RepID=A0A2T9XY13_9FUNG|nr:hypothetical protein BB560_007198 [Smittium megazygosporum]
MEAQVQYSRLDLPTQNQAVHQQTNSARESRPKTSAALLFALTVSFFGIQIVWSVEMGYGTPYLIELGLAKSLVPLVWLAGPLSGI